MTLFAHTEILEETDGWVEIEITRADLLELVSSLEDILGIDIRVYSYSGGTYQPETYNVYAYVDDFEIYINPFVSLSGSVSSSSNVPESTLITNLSATATCVCSIQATITGCHVPLISSIDAESTISGNLGRILNCGSCDLITNGDFENGTTGWTLVDEGSGSNSTTLSSSGFFSHSPTHFIKTYSYRELGQTPSIQGVSQDIIFSGSESIILWVMFYKETNGTFVVLIDDDIVYSSTTNITGDPLYERLQIDITGITGTHTLSILTRFIDDTYGYCEMWLDDISVISNLSCNSSSNLTGTLGKIIPLSSNVTSEVSIDGVLWDGSLGEAILSATSGISGALFVSKIVYIESELSFEDTITDTGDISLHHQFTDRGSIIWGGLTDLGEWLYTVGTTEPSVCKGIRIYTYVHNRLRKIKGD